MVQVQPMGSPLMYMDYKYGNDGNTGIGTRTPSSSLGVSGPSGSTGTTGYNGRTGSSGYEHFIANNKNSRIYGVTDFINRGSTRKFSNSYNASDAL